MINILKKIITFFKKYFFLNSFFIFVGSSIWFIFRTGTKPSRYVYPCQKFARGNIGLFGPPVLIFLFHKLRHNPRFRRNIFVGLSVIIVSSYFIRNVYLTYKLSLGKKVIAQATNSKVVWIKDVRASLGWEGVSREGKADQTVISSMMKEGIMSLTGTTSVNAAWTKIFQDRNEKNGLGRQDYAQNEKIVIKINNNNGCNYDANEHCPVIQTIRALLHELTDSVANGGKGIPQANVTVYDASRGLYTYQIDGIRKEFANVVIGSQNCSSQTILGAQISQDLVDAKYLINMPLLRTHGYAGVTLSFKNHLGSMCTPANFHDSMFTNSTSGNSLVVLNNNSNIKNKTTLIIDDAIFGMKSGGPGGDPGTSDQGILPYPNSLFLSQDPVAVDSVMVDYLKSLGVDLWQDATANYRSLAAQAGLGNYAASCSGSACSFTYSNIDLTRCNQTCAASPTLTPTPTSPPTSTPTSTPTPYPHCTPLGDIDCSGKVTTLDLSTLLSKFNTSDVKSDLDDSGTVNALDLFRLLQNFGK